MIKLVLIPFIIRDDFKHPHYKNSQKPYFETIAFDNDFLVELSETSDNRPYFTISTTEIHTASHNSNIQIHDPNGLLSDTSESQVQYSQQSPQTTQPIIQQPPNVQFENLSLQLDDNHNNDNNQNELQYPKPTLDTQSTDSNAFLVPVKHVDEQDIRRNAEQDPQYLIQGSLTLSTTNTNISLRRKVTSYRNIKYTFTINNHKSEQYNWYDQENILLAFLFTPLLLLYTFFQLPNSIIFCQKHCISTSWNNLHLLTVRSNQFS